MKITKEQEQDIIDDEKRELINEARDEAYQCFKSDSFNSLCVDFIKEEEPEGFDEFCKKEYNDWRDD